MPRFHSLKVREVRRETADCVSVSFEAPEHLKEEYRFQAGQHLTLRTFLNGEEIRRSYSICSSPLENDLRVAIKRLDGGVFSTFANLHLKPGDPLDVMTPMGSFSVHLDPSNRKHYVAFAAGSGITPILSILKTVLMTEPDSHFTLFFGNRSTDSVIFLEELEGLKNRFLQRLSIHYLMTGEDPGYELLYGRIDQEKTKTLCSQLLDMEEVDEFFLCGPSPMIEAIRETLKEEKVPAEKVHFELFNTPANASGANKRANLLTDIKAEVTITLDGKTFSYQHPSVGETILDEARKKGGDLPFACKGGVCCTCKAKVLEGAVEMELNYGLVAEEVKIGYVLTCQAHPKTEKVVLSFDE